MDLKVWNALSEEEQFKLISEQPWLDVPLTDKEKLFRAKRRPEAEIKALQEESGTAAAIARSIFEEIEERRKYLVEAERGTPGTCSAGLLELRNALKREIQDERDSSIKYREAAGKLYHHGISLGAQDLTKMALDEHMHSITLDALVDYITNACGE